MRKILSLIFSLVFVLVLTTSAFGDAVITGKSSSLSVSGTTLTGHFSTSADRECMVIGAQVGLYKRVLTGTTWTLVTSDDHETSYASSFNGMDTWTVSSGAEYKLQVLHHAQENGNTGNTISSTVSNYVTIPFVATTFDSKWCSASRSGYNVNTTASCTMNQTCKSIKISWSLQKLNESGLWSTVSSKSSTKTNDDAYAASVSFGITTGYTYRVKATFTVVGPDNVTVTGTSYSGSV